MKKNILQHTKLLVAFLAVFSMSSCEKPYFEDINNDPNNPTAVPPKVLLPTIQASLAYAQGGDMARYTSLFTQQITGNARQFAMLALLGSGGDSIVVSVDSKPWKPR